MMKYKKRKKYFDDDILNLFDNNKSIEALKKAVENCMNENGWNQKELSKQIGVAESDISKLFKSKKKNSL